MSVNAVPEKSLAITKTATASGTMAITTILFYLLARSRWNWSVLHAGAFAVFFLIMSSACTTSPSITPTLTVPPTKDATRIAAQVRKAAKSNTADARLATPYGLSKGACSPFRGHSIGRESRDCFASGFPRPRR